MNKICKNILAFVLLFMLCSCSENVSVNENQESIQTNSEIASTQQNSEKIYHIGDEIIINNDDEEYKLTFTGIKETTERNQFSDTVADRVVIVSYEYENISQSTDLYISSMNFKLYDKENEAMETYPANVKMAQSVGTGRKASGEEGYALNSDENYIELEYYDNMFNSKADCKVILEW